ncbi:unnamed protein product, partial [Soboliphyme baturini]|uniref:ANK_REP_REGION domain-containing protein n=1 Tax=Soboliphyme baturini TaxID=241478 RepID=A0A183IAL3_9BILA
MSNFREEKESFIRSKYEAKEFLAPTSPASVPVTQLLMEAVCKQDLRGVVRCLSHCSSND